MIHIVIIDGYYLATVGTFEILIKGIAIFIIIIFRFDNSISNIKHLIQTLSKIYFVSYKGDQDFVPNCAVQPGWVPHTA